MLRTGSPKALLDNRAGASQVILTGGGGAAAGQRQPQLRSGPGRRELGGDCDSRRVEGVAPGKIELVQGLL